MKTGRRKTAAVMHLYTYCQSALLMQTQGKTKPTNMHTLYKDKNFNSIIAYQ